MNVIPVDTRSKLGKVIFNLTFKKVKKRKHLILFLVPIIFIAAPANVFSQSQFDYAEFLMHDRDYFRAISTYKHIMFFSNDPETTWHCLRQIAKAYYKSNRFKASIQFSSRLLNQPNLPSSYFNSAQIYLGLSYYGLRVYPMAEDHFLKITHNDTSGYALYYLALLELERGNWNKASKIYREVSQEFSHLQVGKLSEELSRKALDGDSISKKNPVIAATLSTILPGSGQFYCHHYYDGIQAFMYVGAFAFATYAAYRYDKEYQKNYTTTYIAISITSLFHIANIIGAQRTASYYNLRQRQKFLDPIREKVFSIEY